MDPLQTAYCILLEAFQQIMVSSQHHENQWEDKILNIDILKRARLCSTKGQYCPTTACNANGLATLFECMMFGYRNNCSRKVGSFKAQEEILKDAHFETLRKCNIRGNIDVNIDVEKLTIDRTHWRKRVYEGTVMKFEKDQENNIVVMWRKPRLPVLGLWSALCKQCGPCCP
jgi:hypothetical protein